MVRVDVELRLGLGLGPRNRALVEGFDAISTMADRLGIASTVRERAKLVFRNMEEAKAWPSGQGVSRAYRSSGTIYAACLAIACRSAGPSSANTLKEITAVTRHPAGAGAAMKEISKLSGRIRKRLGEEGAGGKAAGVGAVRASSYVRRFGPLIEIGDRELAMADEAARRLEESDLDVRHNGQSVAAGIVYLAANAAHPERVVVTYKDVAAATRVATSTLCLVCKTLRPHAQLLFG